MLRFIAPDPTGAGEYLNMSVRCETVFRSRGGEYMSFVESIQTVLGKYCVFQGRARRSEYWWFTLAYSVVSGILSGLAQNSTLFAVISGIFSLALLLPSLGVNVRRLHDVNKSGWWILIVLIPLVGWIIDIVWCVKDSDPGDNQFGPNPKGM